MSWGYRVILIIVVFVAGILSLVFISMRQTNEMVDSNYYEKELKYQQVIDGKKNLKAMGDSVSMNIAGNHLEIRFPAGAVSDLKTGTIRFLRLSGSKDDQQLDMHRNARTIYQVPLASLAKGWYKVQLEWVNAGTGYYQEQNFQIQ